MTTRAGSDGAAVVAPVRVLVMGVSGSGKSTVGRALAERLGGVFIDADDLHDPAARAKMAGGTPLTDEDRWPWLARVAVAMNAAAVASPAVVVACSALRKTYRDAIRGASEGPVVTVHLDLDRESLHARMTAREHFMPATLLDSQRSTLESLGLDEVGIQIDASMSIDAIVDAATTTLRLGCSRPS
ncbi:gluconokinase [Microbacterium sp. NPDC056569]|uniref:gluconokinase n=1 Tax=Microbacterium sp. NPDC056569 TaxID=3345867 RepID=UPI00366FF726